MASPIPTCDLCLLVNSTEAATFWCFCCDEYFCGDCELKHRKQKTTKEHESITIDEYQNLPESVTSIKQECSDHDLKYDFYCKIHDVPCCLRCISKSHKGCDEIIPLEDVIRNVKESFLVEDLRNRIEDIPGIIKLLLEDLTMEKSRVLSERQRVFKEIEETRNRINQHVDTLQAKLVEKYQTEQNDILNKLEERAKRLEKLRTRTNKMSSDFSKIEKYASNFHTYCSINAMTNEIKQYEDEIDCIQKNSDESFESMNLKISTELSRLTRDVDRFGSIDIQYRKSPVYHFKKEQQGQKVVQNPGMQLNKTLSFDIPRGKIATRVTGCCVMETGDMILCNFNNNRLLKTTSQGELIKTFHLQFQPYDVKSVNKSTIAVTSAIDMKLVLVNVHNGTIEKRVFSGEPCYGLCYKDDTFTVCTNDKKKILTVDMEGRVLSTINTDDWARYCSVMNGKIYYTEHGTDKVLCCDKKGQVLWKYDCEKGDSPLGIVVDQAENVFVACDAGKKVIWIDKSGKNSKVILTEKDGLVNPRCLYFCERNKSLLVCNVYRSCYMYKLN